MSEISIREGYGKALAEYGSKNPNIVVLDADTSASTKSSLFAKIFPERFFNVGIAEPCLIDVAVGMALGEMIPFANAFAALLALRALEQIRTCVCYAKANVKIAAGYAGLSDYKDGATHHAITDIAIMRALPELTIIVAADAHEAGRWVPLISEFVGPVYFRLSRAASLPVNNEDLELKIGKGLTLREGEDVTIVATGAMVGRSLVASEELLKEGISVRLLEIHTIKPLDSDLIQKAALETGAIVTAEEHSIIGGLGGAVAEVLCLNEPTILEQVGIDDKFARTALSSESLMDFYGLAIKDIVSAAKRALTRKNLK